MLSISNLFFEQQNINQKDIKIFKKRDRLSYRNIRVPGYDLSGDSIIYSGEFIETFKEVSDILYVYEKNKEQISMISVIIPKKDFGGYSYEADKLFPNLKSKINLIIDDIWLTKTIDNKDIELEYTKILFNKICQDYKNKMILFPTVYTSYHPELNKLQNEMLKINQFKKIAKYHWVR